MPQAQFPASGSFQEVSGVLRAENDPTLNSLPVEKHPTLLSLLSLLVKLYETVFFSPDCKQDKQWKSFMLPNRELLG